MEYVKLGNTGLEVSKICLGCMSFGDPQRWIHSWVLNETDSRKIIKKALDLGINFFDTANVYGLGASEEILGRALQEYAKREEIVIATKVSGQMHEGPNGKGLSRKAILHEVEQCLKRLGTDYIDLLYIHRWDYNTPIEETMCALNDLVRAGKVHYNLLYREEEREMIPLCKDMKVALVPYSPLAAGRLTRDWNSDSKRAQEDLVAKRKYDSTVDTDRKIVERVAEIADKYQVAVAWLWAKGVTAPIVGITKEKYLDDFAGALTVKLTQEDIEYLEECYQPHVIMGHN